jgi:ElaB/YqjD/DUF883 family membrane-anchored ribosome-binding protein
MPNAAKIESVAKTAKNEAEGYLHDGQEWLEEADSFIRQAMKEHPATCLFVALGLGYTIGRLISKR